MSSAQEQENKIKELNKKLSDLENTIKNLKSELVNKDIIISALVEKLRINIEASAESVKRLKREDENFTLPGLENVQDESSLEENTSKSNIPNPVSCESNELITQIKDIFLQKSKSIDFKPNYSFKKFVDYVETSFEFSLFNKKIFRIKNPLKQFLDVNLDRIIKFIIENVNFFNMNQICSTLFLINSEIPYKQKLVVFHDIVMELENFSKLNFIASALFNNNDLEGDLFSQLIKKIMYHQICIDGKLIKDPDIQEYYGVIRDNFTLMPSDISLWDSLSHFLVSHTFFDSVKKTIKPESIEKGFALRMVCSYLDWDYTFNTFIRTQLHPKILSDRSPIHVYYIGILMMNAKRFFGSDESITIIEEELRSIMEWKDECSIVSYLIMKQLYPNDSELWIVKNSNFIGEMGFDLKYLKTFFLL